VIEKIVFFCFSPFIKQHYKRFGAEVLESNGFDVWFYDFSPIVFPSVHKGSSILPRPVIKNYFLVRGNKEAVQAIQNLGSECLVVMTGYYQAENFKIFQALSKTSIPYAFYASETDAGGNENAQGSLLEKFLLKLSRVKLTKLKNTLYKPKFAPLFGIRPPSICLLGGENTLKNNGAAALIGEKTEFLWAHSHDYDEYLEHLHKKGAQENFAVFVDLGGPKFPWDHLNPNRSGGDITSEKYYPSLCRFFDYVERELELEVIIAAHPKSNHVDHPEYFGRRRTFYDQTLHLIQKSKLVISMASTALSYVVLEKKPLLFFTTVESEACLTRSKHLRTVGLSLGTNLINIDEEPYSINWEKELPVNEAMYLKYKQQNIKKEGSEEINTWQIFANHLKK
jgi:hypothetical protein